MDPQERHEFYRLLNDRFISLYIAMERLETPFMW